MPVGDKKVPVRRDGHFIRFAELVRTLARYTRSAQRHQDFAILIELVNHATPGVFLIALIIAHI